MVCLYTPIALEHQILSVLEHKTNTSVCLSKYVYIHQSSFINVHTVTQNYSSYKSAINVYIVVANINVTFHIKSANINVITIHINKH